jgi:predicted XRE-type DNA-binding protein
MNQDPSDIPHVVSSGNVFRDLGFEDPDLHLAKALVAETVRTTVEERGLDAASAAALLRVDQPTLRQVLEGDVSLLTLDSLLGLLRALGHGFEIVITPPLAA